MKYPQLRLWPLTLEEANELVTKLHRHHERVQGYKFAIGVRDGRDRLRGAAIVGRPTGRMRKGPTAEVTRLVTDGARNACSMLYAACARAAFAMGFTRIQTFILRKEPGTSLKAAGWTFEGWTRGVSWSRSYRKRRDKHPVHPKQRWFKEVA